LPGAEIFVLFLYKYCPKELNQILFSLIGWR
jgi:hypothetical protein